MAAKVSKTEKNSIAEELGLEQGDILLSIDDVVMKDFLDYQFLCKSNLLILKVQKTNGEIEEIEIEKDEDEDLGIIFESAVFENLKKCKNKCIFCFVDQQPKGLRDSLYVKDDDYRLSYLQGTYITLTNLTEEDKKRIEMMHLGPLYISVHTTNPELRVKMMKNPEAAKIMEHLKWLKKIGVPFNAQIVLCPGYNDGKELKRTLDDLTSLKSALLSVAIVPLGVTNFRKTPMKQVDKKVAKETLKIASNYEKVCCSDEFFLKAEEEIPDKKYYGNFCQLDDGVGSIRFLLEKFKENKLPKAIKKPLKITIATSILAEPAIKIISTELNKIKNLETDVLAVKSKFWGETITVAGLITGEDIIENLKGNNSDYVVISSVMLKPFTDLFLDGISTKEVEKKTGKKLIVIKDRYSFSELIEIIKK